MCTKPLIGIPTGQLTDKGKIKYYIRDLGEKVWEEKFPKDRIPETLFNNWTDRILIPCGKCKECRLRYAKMWSDRCMLELQYHESSYFVTLTYSDEQLPTVQKNGLNSATLRKRDFQLFMKNLRSKLDYPVRYYMCGEYGTDPHKSHRPHYHAIIFGLKLNDLQWYSRSSLGDDYWISPFLDSIWSDENGVQRGHVVVTDVTPASCAYVARYTQKKVDHDYKVLYDYTGILPEYTNMSLKPGIGLGFDKDNFSSAIFDKGYECISTETGGLRIYPPRYFEKFYEELFPDKLAALKEHRTVAMRDKTLGMLDQTSQTFLDHLESIEIDLNARTSSLVRNKL